MADAGYNINPSIADSSTFTPEESLSADTSIVFSSPGSSNTQGGPTSQTLTPTTTATATAAGGNATPQDSGNVGTGAGSQASGSNLSILDWILISVAAGLALLIIKKHLA